MNLQENIRRILREIEEDKIQIRLGRSAERHFGKVQNIIIMVDDQDITSEDDVPGLGKMNIVIKDNEIIVGDIFIPEKYRKQGIATIVYQKISDYFNLPIVNSKTKGFNQTIEGGHIWKDREKFEPKNLQESISRILRENSNFFIRKYFISLCVNKYERTLIRRLEFIDEQAKFAIPQQFDRFGYMGEEYYVTTAINIILFRIRNIGFITQNDMEPEYHKSVRKFVTERYEKEIREYFHSVKN